jgi:hypothetical protein
MSDKTTYTLDGFLRVGNKLLMHIKDKFGVLHTIDGPQQQLRKMRLDAELEGHNQVVIEDKRISLTNDRVQPWSMTTS